MIGAAAPGQFPPPFLPEVAFVGKSNVGKSSLINALLNRKQLVKTSSTPGKTRQINFFLINGQFRFVDLPGYGFTRAGKSRTAGWEALIESYLSARSCLKGLVMILDVRHAPTKLDQAMIEWLEQAGLRFVLVANKADKLSRSQLSRHLAALRPHLAGSAAPLAFSAKSSVGKDALWTQLSEWLAEPLDAGAAQGARP